MKFKIKNKKKFENYGHKNKQASLNFHDRIRLCNRDLIILQF